MVVKKLKIFILMTVNMESSTRFTLNGENYFYGDPETDPWHLDHDVTYADVIIVCFHDTLYQLKSCGVQCTLQSNFAFSSHNDLDS